MTSPDLPELPSDEELGIAGMDEDDLPGGEAGSEGNAGKGSPGRASPPPGARPPYDAPPAEPSGPGRWLAPLVVLLVVMAGIWAFSPDRVIPDPVPANAPDTAFSSGRAMAQLVDMAREPRPVGAPEHTRVRELLLERMRDLGLDPHVHTTMSLRRTGQTVRATTLRNLVGRLSGTGSTGAVLVTAHYDGAPLSRAAGDDGAGVVAVLEAVRALQAGAPPANDVIVLFTDGEEKGLLGARAFVEEHRWMDDVALVLSMEMRGGGGPSIMFETGLGNGWIVQAMKAGDPRPMAHSLGVEVYRRMPNDTDFTAFRDVGIQGLNFAAIDDAWIYHQPTDRASNVDEATVQHHGVRLLGILRELGDRDLTVVNGPDRVHFVLPLVGLVDFPAGWALPLAGGLLLFWILGTLLVLVRGARVLDLLVGLGVGVGSGVLAGVMGWALMAWLPRFHPEFGYMTPAFYGEGWYVLALVAAVAALAAAFGLAGRWFTPAGLAMGALLIPVLGALGSALVAPLTVSVLLGPGALGVLAVALWSLTGPSRESRAPGAARWILAALLALPVMAFMVPVLELLWVALSLRLAPVLAVGMLITLICMLPALQVLLHPNRWWFPVGAVAVAVGLVGTGIVTGGPSEEHPLPSTLIYAQDRTSHETFWATRDDPGLDWVEEEFGPFTRERSLEPFFVAPVYGTGLAIQASYFTAPAPLQELEAPLVQRVGAAPAEAAPAGDQEAGAQELEGPPSPEALPAGEPSGRTPVGVTVESRIGAEIVAIRVREEEGGVVAVGGRDIPPAPPGTLGGRRPITQVVHQGVPDGDLTFDLEVSPEFDVLSLEVMEQHLRPDRLLEAHLFQRPPGLMPSPRARSDRALIRTSVEIRLRPLPDPAS